MHEIDRQAQQPVVDALGNSSLAVPGQSRIEAGTLEPGGKPLHGKQGHYHEGAPEWIADVEHAPSHLGADDEEQCTYIRDVAADQPN